MIELQWDRTLYPEESASLEMLDSDENTLVVGTDFSDAPRTIASLVEGRRKGRTVALHPMLADPLERIVEHVATAIASQGGDAKYAQLLALRENRLNVNQKPMSEAAQYDAASLRAAALAAKLSDVLLFFTPAEKERWSALTGKPIRRFAYLPIPRVHSAPVEGRGVAVYAPQASHQQLAFVALALAERRVSSTVICADNPNAPLNVGTVIVPSWWRPARVAALAAAGYRVVAPTSGSPDDRCACATYRPTDALALSAALDSAQSAPHGVRFDVNPEDVRAIVDGSSVPRVAGPRVSVIVRTFDRQMLLPRALRSIAAQTYADVEIVVVNNGGEDVRDIVEKHCGSRPRRYERLAERKHISAASNAGARAASGTYIAYLDDDDLLYPDHLARAIDALERSGADIAYTNCIAEYARMDGDTKHLLGFQIFRESDFIPKDLYVDNVAPIHSIVHRRDVFERFGFFDEDLAVTDDWEMWLRASRGARFVHVDRVTCEYSWRVDPAKGNMTLTHQRQFAESYEKITSRYEADVRGFPNVTAQQAQVKAAQQQRAKQVAEFGARLPELTIAAMAQNAVPAVPLPIDPFA
ncbi:MAG TPA: glycosyltransferase [Candidatus Baltobacteraceae bacterium]|nr:glycosyltransferase [Candidatus Baltobacteraceae bacterium]